MDETLVEPHVPILKLPYTVCNHESFTSFLLSFYCLTTLLPSLFLSLIRVRTRDRSRTSIRLSKTVLGRPLGPL